MKAFSRQINKFFKRQKKVDVEDDAGDVSPLSPRVFAKFCMSLMINSGTLNEPTCWANVGTFREYYQRDLDLVYEQPTKNIGSEVLHFGPIVWKMLPDKCKSCETLDEFKNSVKTWEPKNCPCELCNRIIPGFGRIKQHASENSDFYYY